MGLRRSGNGGGRRARRLRRHLVRRRLVSHRRLSHMSHLRRLRHLRRVLRLCGHVLHMNDSLLLRNGRASLCGLGSHRGLHLCRR